VHTVIGRHDAENVAIQEYQRPNVAQHASAAGMTPFPALSGASLEDTVSKLTDTNIAVNSISL